MLNIISVEQVNFYGDILDIGLSDEGMAYAQVSQICAYLQLDLASVRETFEDDPRTNMQTVEGVTVIPLNKLNGFLMLIRPEDVKESAVVDLLKYQVECYDVLYDYWINGVAINRREIPYLITSRFRDEREISRKALTDACAKYCKDKDMDPGDMFYKVLEMAYSIIGLEPKAEDEKMRGSEAKYLAWVESTYAGVINKFAGWQQEFDSPVAEATKHVEKHLRDTGAAWLVMADNIPASIYRD